MVIDFLPNFSNWDLLIQEGFNHLFCAEEFANWQAIVFDDADTTYVHGGIRVNACGLLKKYIIATCCGYFTAGTDAEKDAFLGDFNMLYKL